MCLTARPLNEKVIEVEVPITRGGKYRQSAFLHHIHPPPVADVLQECDIVEDVCIAFGYNNIDAKLPATPTVGKQLLMNKMSDLIREEVASAGYKEGLNFVLVAKEDLTTRLNKEVDEEMVIIDNPNVHEFSVGRTTLIPGCLKWLSSNKKNKVGRKSSSVCKLTLPL